MPMHEKYLFRYFDITHCMITVLLCCIGLLFVFSSTYQEHRIASLFFKKQAIGMAIGFVLYAVFACIDYRTTMRYAYFAYFVLIGMLIFTLAKGSIGMGAQRWINLGLFKLQPSELAKVLFPAHAVYTLYSVDRTSHASTLFARILITLCISVVLILKQPDLGTALLVLFSGLLLCWLAGLSRTFFLYLFIMLVCILPLSKYILKEYQLRRITVFLGYGSSDNERYQIEQAQIAIGSGGLFGKGLLHGTQNKLHFLPEGRTDFIFAVLCEEWGLIGALLVLALYCVLFLRSFMIIWHCGSHYMQLLAAGLILHSMLSTVINIGMVLGLLPIVGIPLPLMSYGISNLWVNLISFGWFQNIAMHRAHRGEL